MMGVIALSVIGERLDDGAVAGRDPARAGRRDPLKLLLQRAQFRDLVADFVEMRDRDRMLALVANIHALNTTLDR